MDAVSYWNKRWRSGQGPGDGSVGKLLDHKIETLNRFNRENGITVMIDVGCGDGRIIDRIDGPLTYIGFDVSEAALSRTEKNLERSTSDGLVIIRGDGSEIWRVAWPERTVSISLDVIFHLLDEESLNRHLTALLAPGGYILVYSSDHDEISKASHVRHWHYSKRLEVMGKRERMEAPPSPFHRQGSHSFWQAWRPK